MAAETGVEVESRPRLRQCTLSAAALSNAFSIGQNTPQLIFLNSSCPCMLFRKRRTPPPPPPPRLWRGLVAAGVQRSSEARAGSDRTRVCSPERSTKSPGHQPYVGTAAFCTPGATWRCLASRKAGTRAGGRVAEWATPIIHVREDVVFATPSRAPAIPPPIDWGARLNAVPRAPIQRQLRLAVIHRQDVLSHDLRVAGGAIRPRSASRPQRPQRDRLQAPIRVVLHRPSSWRRWRERCFAHLADRSRAAGTRPILADDWARVPRRARGIDRCPTRV